MRSFPGKHICKSPCGRFVLRPFENLRDSYGNLCGSCLLDEPYARSKAQHPNGVVSLIAAHWYAYQRHTGRERLQHSAVTSMGYDNGGFAKDLSVWGSW